MCPVVVTNNHSLVPAWLTVPVGTPPPAYQFGEGGSTTAAPTAAALIASSRHQTVV